MLHVPLTYRGAPLTGAEAALVGTMQHSVLGPRWVYDGCADAVYATALASAVLTGGTQADLEVATASGPERREPTTRVSGSGTPGTAVPALAHVTCADDGRTTVITAGPVQLVVLRAIGAPEAPRRRADPRRDLARARRPGAARRRPHHLSRFTGAALRRS